MTNLKQNIINLVNKIPAGKVTNFGEIGKQLGVSGQIVGFMLSGMKKNEWLLCPWYRVVAKNGFISSLKLGHKGIIQKQTLVDEGYNIIEDCVDMNIHYWSFDQQNQKNNDQDLLL